MIGQRYGRLVVTQMLEAAEAGQPCSGAWCLVRCDCGARKRVRARHLRAGSQRSCGCLGREENEQRHAAAIQRRHDKGAA